MRILLTFLIGLFSCFYLTDLITRFSRRSISSLFGVAMLIAGIILALLSGSLFGSVLDTLLSTFLIGSGFGLIGYHLLSRGFIISERAEKGFIRKHEKGVTRALEIFPGALTWLALTSPIWLSFTLPFAVAYLIILADIYWLFNSFKISVLVLIGYRKMEAAKKTDWIARLKKDFPQQWEDYYHLILVPTYKEALYILEPNFEAIANSDYPKKKIMLLVGFEGRDSKEKIDQVNEYLKKYEKRIGAVFTTIHPYGLPGEVPGQGSNKNWMIKHTLPKLKKMGIDPKKVIVTTLDADFVIHQRFLAGMLHKYLSLPATQRDKISMTGAFLYNNNYWQAPTPMRLLAAGTAYWQLSEMVGSDKYINFSSLSMNLDGLLKTGLWIPDKVNDDSGFFWKSYYTFRGEYKVIPHYLPISADANLDVTLWKTFQNTYQQLKRWAYGVEHIPFIFTQYFERGDIDFWDKTDKLFFIIWSYFKWGTLALFITFGGLLIPVMNPHYSQSVLTVNLPTISSWILDGAFLGLFSTIFVHERTVPPRPKTWNKFQIFWSYLQWLLVPIILVTIATIPAIDAQTTLMLGKHIEFRVTNKARVVKA